MNKDDEQIIKEDTLEPRKNPSLLLCIISLPFIYFGLFVTVFSWTAGVFMIGSAFDSPSQFLPSNATEWEGIIAYLAAIIIGPLIVVKSVKNVIVYLVYILKRFGIIKQRGPWEE